ncbi:Tetrathionate reductase subunit B precursor [Enhygromyxa salina]|uniref:Tetrathionate reductase subunit B n=1 Tax=Enhygromyxa salina TaxID=215803 RepID=A0A2S9XZP0_9BACT|nr:4Fe-4S dicluster domain-containing protein [Enhygromyxa salina]PRP98309.1 Tetrathionate reductase subunit B precursor [Enhygromyxa salina]
MSRPTNKPTEALKTYWTSVQRRKTRLSVLGSNPAQAEFPPGADELVVEGGASRRKFMGLLGASTALAGLSSTGCVRKPVQNVMPFAKRPEDLIPGAPTYYATAYQVGGTVMGLLVESQDGRPIKIEGNPQHSGSQGATDVYAQASVLNLYDPQRSAKVRSKTVSAHAFAAPGQGEQAKQEVIHGMCERLRQLTLHDTNSIDAADQAEAKCAQLIEQAGRWNVYIGEDGREVTELSIDWDTQVETNWGDAWAALSEEFAALHSAGGEGLALVVPGSLSPSFRALQQRFVQTYPKAKVVLDDPTYPINSIRAAEMVAGEGARAYHDLEQATVIVAADSDFLGVEQDHVRLARQYAARRKLAKPGDTEGMNRLYVVEPHLTSTGAQADERLRLPGGDIVDFLAAVVIELVETHGATLPPGAQQFGSVIKTRGQFDPRTQRFVAALAEDLAARIQKPEQGVGRVQPERVCVIVGERQPPLAHGLGYLINAMMMSASANPPGTLRFGHRLDNVPYASLSQLASGLEDGTITSVLCLGTNPVYDAPGALGLAEKLAGAKLLVHAGTHHDETGQLAHWHLPLSHYLEAWGDLEAVDGTTSIQQPLIAPLHDTRSAVEILAMLVPHQDPASGEWALSTVEKPGDKLIREHWKSEIETASATSRAPTSLSEKVWRRWLHDGLVSGIPRSPSLPRPNKWQAFADLMVGRTVEEGPYEINFHLDPKVLAGEYSNNGWMQELPHPISKLTWDNGAYISATLAAELGVENGDNLAIKVGDASISVPAWIAPGQHDRTVSLNLGYGRHGIGPGADEVGFDVNPLRRDEARWFARGEVSRGSGNHLLVSTQDYGLLDPDGEEGTPILNYERRPIYREASVAGFKEDPNFSKKGDLMPKERLKEPWARYDPETQPTLSVPIFHGPHQWAMSVDLNSCISCNACVIACQAENNIPVVGKKEVSNGREMHWIRIDRYYTGPEDNPDAVVMPMLCQHCETAPCENVCPVAATAHSPEGLNDMAYNRCIGTRYCANNCPYKVRRFNFFNYNKRSVGDTRTGWGIPEIEQMQKNPDVTVRFRGVIEKCSYCVQRINAAKIEAHIDGRDKVRDGEVVTACEQVCPTQAITFGDLTDPESRVSQLKYSTRNEDYREREQSPRDYAVLQDLLTKPRTTYLARVRNPNPKLA